MIKQTYKRKSSTTNNIVLAITTAMSVIRTCKTANTMAFYHASSYYYNNYYTGLITKNNNKRNNFQDIQRQKINSHSIPLINKQCLYYYSSNNNNENNSGKNDNNSSNSKRFRDFLLLQKQDLSSLTTQQQQQQQDILESTIDWLQYSVIGLNLCPFADKPFREGNISLKLIMGTNEEYIQKQVLEECQFRQFESGTSLLICPDLYPTNFVKFLSIYNNLQNDMLIEYNLQQDIQIAPFHPLFEFDGSGSNGIDNWTNRSPYPIFHILREVEVEQAVDVLQGDASKVWKRNVQLLDELHEALSLQNKTTSNDDNDNNNNIEFERVLQGKYQPLPTIVKDILRKLRKEKF